MGRGSSKIGGGSRASGKAKGIDSAKNIQGAFDSLNMGDLIELKSAGSYSGSGVWLVYRKTAWGFSRVSRPGYYNMPGDAMVMVRDFSKYDNTRWRKITDYAKRMYNL